MKPRIDYSYDQAYMVALKLYPHRVCMQPPKNENAAKFFGDRDRWCEAFCGKGALHPVGNALTRKWRIDMEGAWASFATEYLFKNQDHAFAFKMRWA